MIGAIIGDIVGSRFEFQDFKSKDFTFLVGTCRPTDDSLMTIAIAKSLYSCRYDEDALRYVIVNDMKEIAHAHPNTQWGSAFYKWLFEYTVSTPYNSFGNGAAMRISPVAWVATSEEHVKKLSDLFTGVSHNHPEGLKGAEAIAMATYLARIGTDKETIKQRMIEYYPELGDKSFTLDNIRPDYGMDEAGWFVTCQGSVPYALEAFFESNGFEDAIRNAISIGGDADTLACMTGAVAEAYYGVPEEILQKVRGFLSDDLLEIIDAFETIKIKRTNK